LIITILLISTALAASKPIAGKITGATGTVDLFVEVNFLGEKQVCIVNPSVQTGPTGEFATNLGNLVFLNSPQSHCSGFWESGNDIWFEINGHQSEIQQIELGTGLQFLETLTISQPKPSGGNGGGGGGTEPGEKNITTPTAAPITEPSPEIDSPEISALLTAEQKQKITQTSLTINLLNNIQKYLETKVVLFDLNDRILQTEEDNFFLTETYQKFFSFDLENLAPGNYKLRAFVYDEKELVGTSNQVKFTLAPPLETNQSVEIPSSLDQTQYPVYVYVLLILIVLALIIIIWKIKRK